MPEQDQLLSVAAEVSRKYPLVKGQCEKIAKELTVALNSHGISAKHAVGVFTLDEPEAHKYIKRDKENADEYEVEHDWVEVEGKILDLSAKQFRKSVKNPIPDIVFVDYHHPLFTHYQLTHYYHG